MKENVSMVRDHSLLRTYVSIEGGRTYLHAYSNCFMLRFSLFRRVEDIDFAAPAFYEWSLAEKNIDWCVLYFRGEYTLLG